MKKTWKIVFIKKPFKPKINGLLRHMTKKIIITIYEKITL